MKDLDQTSGQRALALAKRFLRGVLVGLLPALTLGGMSGGGLHLVGGVLLICGAGWVASRYLHLTDDGGDFFPHLILVGEKFRVVVTTLGPGLYDHTSRAHIAQRCGVCNRQFKVADLLNEK